MSNKMSYMVSAEDFKRILPNIKIVRFPELANLNNINQVLPKRKDCVILFLIDEEKPDGQYIGHWTCLMRDGDKIEFFDSYGLSPSGDLSHIPMQDRIKFGENHDYLKKLIGGKLRHNPIDYQSWKPGVNTCGRFVITRLLAFMNGITTGKEFYKFMKNAKKEYGCKTFDELVVLLTAP